MNAAVEQLGKEPQRGCPVWLTPSEARPDQDRKTSKRSRVPVNYSALRRKPHNMIQFGYQAIEVIEASIPYQR